MRWNTIFSVRCAIRLPVRRSGFSAPAQALARLDVYASLSYVAEHKPLCASEAEPAAERLDIKDGRHPVVEKMIPNDMFIANDTLLDNGDHRVSVITGPNMAGKSTYMRQTALIVLMAQIGSFVPASKANIGIVDRILPCRRIR